MADYGMLLEKRDKTLSESLITTAAALKNWEAMEPLVADINSVVEEYKGVIDGIGYVFTVVGVLWKAYSDMEKVKQEAAQQEAMVSQIIRAIDGMIRHAVTEMTQRLNEQEVGEVVSKATAVENGFRLNVLPYANTYPLTGFNTVLLDNLRDDARQVIERLYYLIRRRADTGDGAALMILYRNLHTVVQCKLMMDRWRHGLTQDTVGTALGETWRVVEVYGTVLIGGFDLMSDKSFSQGIAYFHAGGGGRPEFNKYSYYYKGQVQPVKGRDWVPVAQAFTEARKAARATSVPEEVKEWSGEAYRAWQQLNELKDKVPLG